LMQAACLAEKIRKSISSMHFGEIGTITASIGVAEYHPEENFQQWYEHADKALYKAKNAGRNRVVVDRNAGDNISLGQEDSSLSM
jgi:diguanylate cyclase (GGDEF)-like protein